MPHYPKFSVLISAGILSLNWENEKNRFDPKYGSQFHQKSKSDDVFITLLKLESLDTYFIYGNKQTILFKKFSKS